MIFYDPTVWAPPDHCVIFPVLSTAVEFIERVKRDTNHRERTLSTFTGEWMISPFRERKS